MDLKTNPRFELGVVFLYLFLFLKSKLSLGADTISADHALSGNSTIVSANGIFEMGFFRPGAAPNFYIGIWYKHVADPKKTVVWVANRDKPISFRFNSELKIFDGNLVLFNEYRTPIWSTDVKSSNRTVQAVLLDSGNLVLKEAGSNPSEPLWQSFDHPTDTLLPRAKIGYNKITNTSQVLTSWKSREDPASGIYSLQIDLSDNSFNLQWNRSRIYWTSGPWNGRFFSLVPEMALNSLFNNSFISNQNESYYTYSIYNNSNTEVFRLVMDLSGQMRQLNMFSTNQSYLFWSKPTEQCSIYAFCGAYGACNEGSLPICRCLTGFEPNSQENWDLAEYSGGCVRQLQLQCRNTNFSSGAGRDRFQEVPNVLLPETEHFRQDSIKECESACLYNCSCTAYAYANSTCSIWTGDLFDLKQLGADDARGRTLYIRLAANESLQNSKGSNSKHYVLIFVIIAVASITSGTAFSVYCLTRKRLANKRGNEEPWGSDAVTMYDSERLITDFISSGQIKEDQKKGIEVPFVVLDFILAATDNFSEANKLGQGGFGPVYKGKFPGGQEVAIKRLSSCSGQGLLEFKNEVLLIAKLQHRNLVRLLGYCIDGDEKMLLYEYMSNKSLDFFLFDQNRKLCAPLNWEIRFNIILGIAKGLLYLHHDSRLRIIHRDLKTSNVLLDAEMNPKISDFGLAKIFGGKETEARTKKVVGTYGYMSPEYALHGLFSIKSDVFSFGVVVLEIISGKRNTAFHQSQEAFSLLDYAWKLWKQNKLLELMDGELTETCNTDEFFRCFNVGLLCIQDDPNDRPTISTAVAMLGSESGSLPRPKEPAFVLKRCLSVRSTNGSSLSKNELTDTLHEGR